MKVCQKIRDASPICKLIKACDIYSNVQQIRLDKVEYAILSTAEAMLLLEAIAVRCPHGFSPEVVDAFADAARRVSTLVYKKFGVKNWRNNHRPSP